MRYKPRDLVRVRKDLEPCVEYPYEGEYGEKLYFNLAMKRFRGRIGRIERVTDDVLDEYLISIDKDGWFYNNTMLMPVVGLSYLVLLRKEH